MYTGRPHDRNTRQCRKTTQQTFPVSFLLGLYFTCTREDPATVTPTCVAKQHNKPFMWTFLSAWVIPHMYTGGPRDRNTRQCRKTTQQAFLVSFLHGFLYLTCTRADPTTVTPASVAQQHNKPFLCLFCMGSIPHMYTGGPNDRNTRQCRTTTQQNLSCVFSAWVIPHMYTGGPRDRNTRQCRKTTLSTFCASFLHGFYTSHVHGRTPRP